MATFQKSFAISTQGHCDVQDVTSQVSRIVAESQIRQGIVNVAGIGSTIGITTLEYESGCVADLRRALNEIAPENDHYAHNARWGDHNGFAHLRSALIGTGRSFPVSEGRILIGTWQQIVFCDFDDRGRDRQVLVTVLGD